MIRRSGIQSHGHLDPEGRLSWSWSPCRIRKGILKSSRCSTAQSTLFITTCFNVCQAKWIIWFLDIVNLGRTKFVSPMIKEGVVFYETLPRFWVGNLLDVEPEMRWVGPICNYSMTIRMVGKVKMQNVKSFTWTNTEIRVRGILQLCATDCGEITWGMENCKSGRTCWRCCQRLGSWGCHLRWKNNDLTLTHLTCQIS